MSLDAILDLARSMGTILALAFYVSIVIWSYKDARKRTDDPILVATFTAIAMLPLFGVFIYMLVRPSEYIADVRERELEIRMMERQLGRQERCPYCKSHIEGEYLSCPVCTTKLRQSCTGCERPLDPRWVMCPFCETEVPGRGRPSPGPGSGADTRRPAKGASAPRAAGPAPRRSSGGRDAVPGRSSKQDSRSKADAGAARERRDATPGPGGDGELHVEPISASTSKPRDRT